MAGKSASDMSLTWNSVNLSSYFDETTLARMADILETTTFGATGKAKVGGLTDGNISASGKFDSTADAALGNSLGVSAAFIFKTGSGSNSTTNPAYSGTMVLSKYDIKGAVGGVVESDVAWEISGAVTRATS
jgi:hypothetical protein